MVLPSKSLAADVTRVRALVCVRSLVDQQVVALGELPVAELADEPLFRPGRATRASKKPGIVGGL